MKNFLKKIKNICLTAESSVKRLLGILAGPFVKLADTKVMRPIINVVKIPFIGYLLLACLLNYFLEVLSRHSFLKAFLFIGESPFVFVYNAFIIFLTLSLVMFAKKKLFATIFVCVIWIVSAFANYIVLCFRTTPFSAVDIMMIRNVMTMLDKYMTKWQMVLSVIGIILAVLLIVYLYFRLPATKHKRNPFRASAYVCMCAILIWSLTKVAVETKTVSDNFGNLAYAYNDYGFAYCFSNSIIDVGISKPKNYSERAVHDIVNELDYNKDEVIFETEEETEELEKLTADNPYTSQAGNEAYDSRKTESTEQSLEEKDGSLDEEVSEVEKADGKVDSEEKTEDTEKEEESPYYKNEPATKEFPNIIIIQLESVFDTKYMKDFYPSEDPLPTFTKLKNEYSSGLFTVPAVGAGTANTEFEVQTGMSTQFFGAGEYPFKTVMRSVSCDSMAYDLKRQGYATTGFHNNDATFYERYVDYSNLGFDSFSGMEHMYNLDFTPRGWAKDNRLDDLMLERMKQTEGRDYITTITVQCHGRYPKKITKTLTDLTCYFGGQYAEDLQKQAAWQYYINMCREMDDMLADLITKLEELDEPTVVFMYGDHLPSLNLLETDLDNISLYQTEWVMWDNIGLKQEKKDLVSYHASTYIFDRLDIEGGLMQKFHAKYMDSVNHDEYISMLEMLEYDTLYGQNYAFDGKNPFPKTDMKMGIREIKVDYFEMGDDCVWIHGSNFNPYSRVMIDEKEAEAEYVNNAMIKVALDDFEKGSELYIAQVGDDNIKLSQTETMPINVEAYTQQSEED